MSYISSEDRGQAALLPAAIEEYVAAASQLDAHNVVAGSHNPLTTFLSYQATSHLLRRQWPAAVAPGRAHTT
jgi:hypothetical protein